ncbi:hypothetical protein P9759_13275, partial [Heyndrickxia coagulans]|nr:hypothetical protein [Heyndrickxia coagulans]
LGMIIRQQDSTGQWANKAYFFWTNHRGDVISIVDQSGNEVGSYTYDAYGNVLVFCKKKVQSIAVYKFVYTA